MANLHNERYDEIKSLLKKSRMLLEQDTQDNVAASVQSRIDQDMDYETAVSNREDGDDIEDGSAPVQKDKTQKYRISGGILALHGKDRSELDAVMEENAAWRYIKMTVDTSNESLTKDYTFFVTEIQPKAAPYEDLLNKKMVGYDYFNSLKSYY